MLGSMTRDERKKEENTLVVEEEGGYLRRQARYLVKASAVSFRVPRSPLILHLPLTPTALPSLPPLPPLDHLTQRPSTQQVK